MPYLYPWACGDIFKDLSHGDMEAPLLHLIFDIAAVLVAEIAEHLGEHPFQGIILHLSARLFTGLNLLVAVVADIEGSTIEMTRILGSITAFGYAVSPHHPWCAECSSR